MGEPTYGRSEKEVEMSESNESAMDVVPVARNMMKDEDHVKLICLAFMHSGKWYDGTNPYARREAVFKVLPKEGDPFYRFGEPPYDKSEKQFVPTDAEISDALEVFKKKGWHAQYDSDVGYYAVFDGTRALGDYQRRFTRNIF